jgi:hypothetical protein
MERMGRRREVEARPDKWAPPVSRRERGRREVGRRVRLGCGKKKREWAGWGRGLGFGLGLLGFLFFVFFLFKSF